MEGGNKKDITLELVKKQTVVWLLKSADNIFAAVSFPEGIKKVLSVILVSLSKKEVAFPISFDNHLTSVKRDSLFWKFGNDEMRCMLDSKNKKVAVPDDIKIKYFQKDVSLRDKIAGGSRVDVKEFEAFILTFD